MKKYILGNNGLKALTLCTFAVIGMSQNVHAADQKLIVTLDSLKPLPNREKLCQVGGQLTNNSFGTINLFRMKFDVLDDRGDRVSPYGGDMMTLSNYGGGSLSSGASTALKGTIIFELKCKYVKSVQNIELETRYCNMKMLPEDRECSDHLHVVSKLDGITVEQ